MSRFSQVTCDVMMGFAVVANTEGVIIQSFKEDISTQKHVKFSVERQILEKRFQTTVGYRVKFNDKNKM